MGKRRKKSAKNKKKTEELLNVEQTEVSENTETTEMVENTENNDSASEPTITEDLSGEQEKTGDKTDDALIDTDEQALPEQNLTEPEDSLNKTSEEKASDSYTQQNIEAVTVDAFLSSLNEIKSNDIVPEGDNGKKKKKKKKASKIIKISFLVFFIAVFAVSAYMIASNLKEGFSANKLYNNMHNEFFSDSERTDYAQHLAPAVLDVAMPKYGNPRSSANETDYRVLETNNQFYEEFKEKLLALKEQNSDVYGWILVDGTNISYPCVKGYDNNYYLDHTVTKEYNANGAIFADSKCTDYVLDNQNLVFYGHNSIYPGQMFHELENYLDESFFRNNRYVTIYTIDGVYRYEIFAFYETGSYYSYCQVSFISENSFINWCNDMKSNSMYYREMMDFTPTSKILTLSTCTNGYFSRRYALQARLVSVEK